MDWVFLKQAGSKFHFTFSAGGVADAVTVSMNMDWFLNVGHINKIVGWLTPPVKGLVNGVKKRGGAAKAMPAENVQVKPSKLKSRSLAVTWTVFIPKEDFPLAAEVIREELRMGQFIHGYED